MLSFIALCWVFVFQVLFNILKVLEIRYTLEKKIGKLMVNSVYIGFVSLGAMFFSIDQMLKGNFLVIFFYVMGIVLGKWIGMKIETDNSRNTKLSILEYFY
jgi:hypothetical protein